MFGDAIVCTYDDLVKAANNDAPVEVTGDWLIVTITNLTKGDFYVAPFYFWAEERRPVRLEILKPGSKGADIVLEKEFHVDRNLDSQGRDQWVSKRYKLNKERHNGKAVFRIGWPDNAKTRPSCPFKIIASPLTSKKLIKAQRAGAGLCPTCGKLGSWQAMAMVCKEHGPFIGGL